MHKIFMFVSLASLATLAQNDTLQTLPPIMLCTGDSVIPIAGKKLVYTYIDNKKTPCMSQPELLKVIQKRFSDSVALATAPARQLFADSNYTGADFAGANFAYADARRAVFKCADLRRAQLTGAKLERTDFSGAYLRKADLRNADLTNANLNGTYLNEADLRNAKGLTVQMLQSCRNFYKAKLDSFLVLELKGCCPEKQRNPGGKWDTNIYKPANNKLKERLD